MPHVWGLPWGSHFRDSSVPSPQPSRGPHGPTCQQVRCHIPWNGARKGTRGTRRNHACWRADGEPHPSCGAGGRRAPRVRPLCVPRRRSDPPASSASAGRSRAQRCRARRPLGRGPRPVVPATTTMTTRHTCVAVHEKRAVRFGDSGPRGPRPGIYWHARPASRNRSRRIPAARSNLKFFVV